jgi:hypothetical protein
VDEPAAEDRLDQLDLGQLRPYFSIHILECVTDNLDGAFLTLTHFLRQQSSDPGRSISAELTAETYIPDVHKNNDAGNEILTHWGFDKLYGLSRRRTQTPSWAAAESRIVDTYNELCLVLGRGRLVAIRSETVSSETLLGWAGKATTPYQLLPHEVLNGTFEGNGTTVWMKGVHRRRENKPDSKALSGIRLQETPDVQEAASFALSAMAINVIPADDDAIVRGRLVISAKKSSVSLKAMPNLEMFLAATQETLDMLEKSLAAEEPPDCPFPDFAAPTKNLTNVFGAYDIRIASPEEIQGQPHFDQPTLERAELLREAVLEVDGDDASPVARMAVGRAGATTGVLHLRPRAVKGGRFDLEILYSGRSTEPYTRSVKEALGDGDLISIYYQSGHVLQDGALVRENLNVRPFTNIEFVDFGKFNILREKPPTRGDQKIHNSIGRNDDDSLFSWVASHYTEGWLICDDGPGEIADFLHLRECGTLNAIHVKAAHKKTRGRGIAVTRFEVLVSQAEKNTKQLKADRLVATLRSLRIKRPACWRDGVRVDSRAEFLAHLQARVASDKTYVTLIQPHLLEATYKGARAAIDQSTPTRDSNSLKLLDSLLTSTQRTITLDWDGLKVIGSK